MKISIVVPAFNEEKLIGTSLRSIKAGANAFSRLGWATEIVVCDNNSSDATANLARAEGAIVVSQSINQISRARNTGAAAATGDWLIFVDADSFPSLELFADVAAEIQTGRCLAGGATVRLDEPHFWGGLLIRGWNFLSRVSRWVAGSFIFCETAAFRQLGGFSEDLFVAEELEFSRRLKRFARKTRRRIVILYRHPLSTSGRKLRLYSRREYFCFLTRAVVTGGRAFKDRAGCSPWYDGRR